MNGLLPGSLAPTRWQVKHESRLASLAPDLGKEVKSGSMSAFVVEQTTIHKILSWLRHEFRESSWLRQIAERYHIDVETTGWEQRIGQAMYDLNIDAVNQRYTEHNPREAFVYVPYPYTSRIAAWKALGCWLYQCSEGTVPQTKLYHYFQEIEKETALSIVMNLPEYEQAQWG